MAATLLDVVSANLVLVGIGLLNQPDEVARFGNALNAELRVEFSHVPNVQAGLTELSRTLTLSRERTVLNLSSSRSMIAREYPEKADLDSLAKVVGQAIACTEIGEQQPRAFGYNIEMVFDQDSGQPALQYIGERLFGNQTFGKAGWELAGGTGRLIFTDSASQWTIALQPRLGDSATPRVSLSLNLHKEEQRFPSESEVRVSLNEVWDEATGFMNRLDEWGAL